LDKGKVETVKTIDVVTWVDYFKTYYAKAIVVLAAASAVIGDVTPILNFLPTTDRNYVTGALAFIAAAVAWLKKEQALVDDL
jgi:hypothetical protein